MSDFERAMPIIRKHECAPACVQGHHEACFTDDPDDPGGATCCGIIQRTYDAYCDQKGTAHRVVKFHSDDERSEIYKIRFWDKANCEPLPWPLNLLHFDAAVNHGTEPKDSKGVKKWNAGRLLQLALKFPTDQIDGIVGDETIAVVLKEGQDIRDIDWICYRYLLERFFRYDDLADANPRLIKYQVGAWEDRLKDLYHYVDT